MNYPSLRCYALSLPRRTSKLCLQDTVVKQNLTRAVTLIGQAMHPDHLKTAHTFTYRDDLLTHMQSYLKSETALPLTNETRSLVLDAATALV